MTTPRYVEVYRAIDSMQAHMLKGMLEDAGIRVVVQGEFFEAALAAIPSDWSTAPRLLVEEQHAGNARSLIQQVEERRRHR